MTTLPTFSDDPAGVAVRVAGAVLFVSGVGWLRWPASAEHTRRLIKNSIMIRHTAVVLLVDRSPSWKGPKALPLPSRPALAPPPTIPRPGEPPAKQDGAHGRIPAHGPSALGVVGFGLPWQAPAPPKLCCMGCGRAAYSQTDFRTPAPCCAMCYHNNGHTEQCDRANGVVPEPDPEPAPAQDGSSANLESHAQESTPVTVRPPRSNPTERPPLTDVVPLQSELPRPPEVRWSNGVSGFDHYA